MNSQQLSTIRNNPLVWLFWHCLVASLLLFFCPPNSTRSPILLSVFQLLMTVTSVSWAPCAFCGLQAFSLIRFLHLWTIDAGWLGWVCFTRSVLNLCTICMVSSPLHLMEATVVAYRYELDVLWFRTSQSARCFLHLFTFVHKMAHQILYISLVRWVASL